MNPRVSNALASGVATWLPLVGVVALFNLQKHYHADRREAALTRDAVKAREERMMMQREADPFGK